MQTAHYSDTNTLIEHTYLYLPQKSMNILALGILSAGLYATGTIYQILIYYRKLNNKQFISLLIGLTAALSQLTIAIKNITVNGQLNFSLFNSASLTAGSIVLFVVFWSIKKPLQSIFLVVYPVAAACIVATLVFGGHTLSFTPTSSGIFTHIVLSILAYSVFSIAATQAILIYLQNNNLKKKNNTILIRNLPPLLTMENLLFQMLWSGVFILVAAIITGIIFIEDIFAQHLAHKTLLSFVALGVFSILLRGRVKYGWRGTTASKFTLWGCGLLVAAFFGSKFVLEWILKDM